MFFEDKDVQVQHFLDYHECQFCHWEFFEDLALKERHISEKHDLCKKCGEVFAYREDTRRHIEEKHWGGCSLAFKVSQFFSKTT